MLGDPERCSDIRCPVGTRGEGERGDERAVGGGSPGLWQGRGRCCYGGGVGEGNETGLFEATRPFRCGGMRRSFRTPEMGDGGTQSGALGWYTVSRWDTRPRNGESFVAMVNGAMRGWLGVVRRGCGEAGTALLLG